MKSIKRLVLTKYSDTGETRATVHWKNGAITDCGAIASHCPHCGVPNTNPHGVIGSHAASLFRAGEFLGATVEREGF